VERVASHVQHSLLQIDHVSGPTKMAERPRKRQKVTYPLVINDDNCPSGSRTIRSKAERLAVEQGKVVERANTLSLQEFRELYCPGDLDIMFASRDNIGSNKVTTLLTSPAVNDGESAAVIDQCFQLIELTSAEDYRKSEMGWSPGKKRKEMQLPDLKYLVLQSSQDLHVQGFISFMVTYEDGREVLYVYEIHLAPRLQGKGLGRKLMEVAEQVGRNVGLEKVMLTVFRSNTAAVGMYTKLGYSVDEYSPQPKILKNGAVKESSYMILSRKLESLSKKKFEETATE
jgi:ribosomal protein S18 acetylase RimI-like enzyme